MSIPVRDRRFAPMSARACSSLTPLGLFALLFRDYRTDHFVSAGLVCLGTGVLHAVPAGVLGWWLLRRGFAVDSVAAVIEFQLSE